MTADKGTWILYQTTNLVNGKIYVGVHKPSNTKYSKYYLGSGTAILSAIEKYGRNNFIRTSLAEFTCVEEAYLAESKMVTEEFCRREDTYNIKTGGMGGRGFTRSAETRARMSTASKGRVHSDATKTKLSILATGRVPSEETRAKLRITSKGKQPYLGFHHSEEAKRKISVAVRNVAVVVNGKYYPSQTKAAIGEKICDSNVRYRVKNNRPKWSGWRYATEEEELEYTSKKISLVEEILDLTK